MKKTKFNVKGMHCKSCEMLLSDALEDLQGVKKIQASADKGIVSVEFDDKIVSENDILSIIKMQGYEIS